MYITSEKLKSRIEEIAREVNERFDRHILLEEYIGLPYFGQVILRFMLEEEDYTLEDLDRYERDLYQIVGDEFLVDFMGSVYRKVGVDYSDLGKIFRAMEAEYRDEVVAPSIHSEGIRADAKKLLKAAGMDPEQKVWEIQLEDGCLQRGWIRNRRFGKSSWKMDVMPCCFWGRKTGRSWRCRSRSG